MGAQELAESKISHSDLKVCPLRFVRQSQLHWTFFLAAKRPRYLAGRQEEWFKGRSWEPQSYSKIAGQKRNEGQ
jgi:hypothetical protein